MFGPCANIFLFSLLVAVATGGFARELTTSDKTQRIVGGEPVHIRQIPYLCQIRLRDGGGCICGGSLVTPRHVVTARHCTDEMDSRTELEVVCGANTQARSGVKGEIIAEYPHPRYRENGTNAFDITILKLKDAMVSKDIATIGISYDPVIDGTFVTVSGWGFTENGYLGSNELARTVRIEKISNERCSRVFQLTKSMMCLGTLGKRSCFGDSGGPATYRNKLVGVVSFGQGCATENYPSVCTSTSSLREFLEQNIRM